MPKRSGLWLLPLGGVLTFILALPFIVPTAPRYAVPPPNTTLKYDPASDLPDWLDGPLPYTLSQTEQANPELAARNILNHYRELFNLRDAAAEFQLVRITHDQLGQTHVRFQQVKDGIPVWGRVLLVHLDEKQALGINGDYQPGLGLGVEPGLPASEAQARALAADTESGHAVNTAPQLMIYVDESSPEAFLTWLVKVSARHQTQVLGYFIDAYTGDVRHISPLSADALYREVYDLQLKDSLPGKLLATEGTVPRDQDGKTAYQNAGVVYNYYKSAFGRDSYDGNGGPLYLLIHSPERGNSFWNGEAMIFGDADGYIADKNDALVLDIMAHELTHAVTQYTANLEYENQSGALNESFSDVFAVMVDRGDWHLFEDNTKCSTLPAGHCWLRDMQDPSLGGDYDQNNPGAGFGQPQNMTEYANLSNSRDGDWGGVHVNSGIPNHVLYLAATASSREATEQIWYRALSVYLTNRSDFKDFATAIQKSAEELYGKNSQELTAVKNALVQTGVVGGTLQPTPAPTTAPDVSIKPTPAPVTTAGCSELSGNGTFEASKPAPWIEQTNLNSPIITGDYPRTGKKSAWLGGTDQETFQYVYQDISIAANMKSVTLTYWHFIEQNANPGAPDATFDALLADPATGNVIATLEEFVSSQPNKDWAQSAIDLSQFAGKKVRLAFTADMVRGNLSNFFVDDVNIAGCTKGGATPTTGGASVTVQGAITDSRTGKAIEGAEFYVLSVSVSEASADGKLSSDEVLASGISDKRGQYRLDKKLARGQLYNVVIIASGYKTIAVDNALEITTGDADPVVQDVVMQKR